MKSVRKLIKSINSRSVKERIVELYYLMQQTDYRFRLSVIVHYLELKLAQFRMLPFKFRGSIVIVVALASAAVMMPTHALTANLAPVSNVSCTWATTCSYANIDEGITPNTADYIGTGSSGSGGETAVFEMADPVNVKTATSLQIAFHAYSATIASTADTVSARLTVGGTQLSLTQGTMTTTPGWYYFTYTGSWTQAQLNDMQFTLTRNMLGSGSKTSQDDDVHVTSIYVSMTYTENSSINQQSYRLYANDTTPSPKTTFAEALGGSSDDYGYSTAPTSDGGFIATGYTLSYASGEQMFLAKYDSSGNRTFYKTWGGTGDDGGFGVIQTSSGGYAVSGYTSTYGVSGSYDLVLVTFDGSGNFVFARAWGGTGTESGYGIVQTSDGGYALTGYSDTTGYTAGNTDMLLVKFSSTGSLVFARTWGGAAGDWGWGITQTSDGGYALVSQTMSFADPDGDILFAKFNSDGSFGYARTWGGTLGDNGYGVVQASDGGYVFDGYYTDTSTGSVDSVIIKLDSAGNFSLANGWNGGSTESIDSLIKTSDGGFIGVGAGNGSGAGDYDSLLMKFDSSINLSFAKTLGGTAYDKGRSVAQTSDGGYAIVGETLTYGAGANEAFVAKYDSTGGISGCSAPTCQTASGTSKTAPGTFTASPAGTMRSPAGTTTTISPLAPVDQTPTVTVIVSVPAPSVGSPLAAANTPAVVTGGTPFRLRVNLGASNGLATDGNFKLQYAPRGTDNTCDYNEAGYADVTASSTVKYYDNSGVADGATYSSSLNDPTRQGVTSVVETYEEASPFAIKNSIPAGQDGLWDFSLTMDASAPGNTSYCIKVVNNDGTDINTYTSIATVSVPPSTLTQSSYRLFENQDGASSPGGALSFGAKTDVTTGTSGPNAVTSADFNGDGKQDMATANGSANTMSVLLGTGTGSFGAKTEFAVGGEADSIVAADFNGDGKQDIAVGNYTASSVSVLLGTGTGSFGAKTDFATGVGPKLGVSADFNGDGKQDLAVANGTDNNVSVLLGTGTGSFGARTNFTVGSSPWGVSVGDFNGDGKADLVSANNGADTLSVLLGTGTGSFGTKTDFATASGPWDVVVADFNGDKKSDFAASAGNGSAIAVLLGTGTGSFGAATTYAAGTLPQATVSADFNGDGKPDMGEANSFGGNVSVYLNTTVFPVSISVGAPLAMQNTPANTDPEVPFRLRSLIAVDDSSLLKSGQSFKLQYKEKAMQVCDPNAIGYEDMFTGGVSSQVRIAGTASSVSLGGQEPWISPGNVTQDDNVNASISVPSGGNFSTESLQTANHGFSIPGSATINGIELIVDRSSVGGGQEAGVQLLKSGVGAGGDKARASTIFDNTAGNWGGPTDLWGTTWTPADINSTGFGASLSVSGAAYDNVKLNVDDVQIKVYYTNSAASAPALTYYNNPIAADGDVLGTNATDPSNGSRPTVLQTYRESDPFTNDVAAIPAGSNGLWDFALTSSAAANGKTYCLRTVKSDGSLLDSYAQMPEITIGTPAPPGPTLEQQLRGGQGVVNGVKSPLVF